MDAIFRKVFKQTCRCIFFSLNFILIFDILFLGFSLMQTDHLIFIKKSFLAYHKAWGIIVPRPGIKPLSPAVDAHALYGFEPPGKSFFAHFKFYFLIVFPFFDSFINLQYNLAFMYSLTWCLKHIVSGLSMAQNHCLWFSSFLHPHQPHLFFPSLSPSPFLQTPYTEEIAKQDNNLPKPFSPQLPTKVFWEGFRTSLLFKRTASFLFKSR